MIERAFVGVSRLLTGASVEWRCPSVPGVQRIYFANHSSHLDFVVIWSALPPEMRCLARPVAGRDYWEDGPVRRYVARDVFHAVLVDRAGTKNCAHASIARMADGLGSRHSLIVFPEGTRSRNGEIGPFKSGLYYLSRTRPDVELIPVRVDNLHRILPKGEAIPVPMVGRVVFGPPVAPPDGESKRDFLERARGALLDLGAPEGLKTCARRAA